MGYLVLARSAAISHDHGQDALLVHVHCLKYHKSAIDVWEQPIG
jgi:hypothetical protein